jgi:ATP-binding cassette, subfamily B, bacterial
LAGAPQDSSGQGPVTPRARWNAEWRQLAQVKESVLLAWGASTRWALASVALMLLQSIFPPLMLYLLKQVMDAVVAGQSGNAPVQAGYVTGLIVLAGAAAMADAATRATAGVVQELQEHAITDRVHALLLAKSTALELAYYEKHEYHDTFHRVQQEAPQRVLHLVSSLNQVIRALATLLGILGLLLLFDWIVIALLFAFTVPALFIRAHHAKEQQRRLERITPMERQASYFRSLLTRIEPAKEVRLFSLGEPFMRRFQALRATISKERVAMAKRKAALDTVTQLLPEVAIFGCLALLAYRGIEGSVSLGGVIVYFWALQWGRSLLNETLGGLVSVYQDNLFLVSLHDFLRLEVSVAEPEKPLPVPRPIRLGITVENVSFRYAGKADNALDRVNLVIRPGEKVALVGENGSGKTTLVKLLCRLYDPTEGEIRLDDVSLRAFGTAALRRELSVVFQDFMCYELTAAENIELGSTDRAVDEPQVRAAAARSGAHEAIARLPSGYATQLGRRFEGGVELSIGEWQKIALARAFTRDSQILILDEPTSALDAEAEYEVFQRFFDLAEGRTAILISHRLSTVRMAERIYVLDRGRIRESGSHNELMSRGAKYARLFNIQAEPYR